MSAAVQISLGEYLSNTYEPDCDFVDGVLEERNVGLKRHSRTQMVLAAWLFAREKTHGHKVLPEQRVKVSPTRVRIPDICLVAPDNYEELTQKPPALWIEIVSPDDRWGRIQTRLADVINFGVPMIWIIDPYSKQAWMMTRATGATAVIDGMLRYAELNLEVPVAEILAEE
jgi:Uma2 family endonuclease